MKKWQYKIIPLKHNATDSQDHNINVSVEETKFKAEKSRETMEKTLNKLGGEGWEISASYAQFVILKKEKQTRSV